jgi:hypothetical protein
MRIFWRFDDSDAGSILASNTASGYKASNLQIDTLGKRWKSDAVASVITLTLNFGSIVSVDSFALLGHNLVPGSDTVTLTYASDPGFITGTGSITVNLTANDWYEYFAAVSRQYWRVTITKSLSTNQVYAGRMVLGTAYVPTYGLAPGYQLGPGMTTTSTTRTKSGAKHSSLGTTIDILRGNFRALPDADKDELKELQNTNQTGVSFIVSMDWENYPVDKSIYGTLDSITPFQNVAINKWDWPLRMTAQK